MKERQRERERGEREGEINMETQKKKLYFLAEAPPPQFNRRLPTFSFPFFLKCLQITVVF